MIKCNYYKNNGGAFLVYGENPTLPDFFKAELLQEDVDPSTSEYRNLDIINKELLILSLAKKRTRDTVLEEEHIRTFNDLSNAYFLIKAKLLHKSKRVRDFVEEKYAEVIELIKRDVTKDGNTDISQ